MERKKIRLEYPNQSSSAKAKGKRLAEKIKKEMVRDGNAGIVHLGVNGNILPYIENDAKKNLDR